MNWSSILQSVLVVVIPPLTAALVALAVAWINKVAKGLSANQMDAIREAASMGVAFAEQTGLLKTGEQKKADAIAAARAYLTKQGVTVDLTLLDNMIEAAVKNDLNWSKASGPVAPPEPTSSALPAGSSMTYGETVTPLPSMVPITPPNPMPTNQSAPLG